LPRRIPRHRIRGLQKFRLFRSLFRGGADSVPCAL
jgi:hypothetical protein